MKVILPFLNPFKWIRAYIFHKKNSKYEKATFDLELFLYSKILKNDMLHYGYFQDVDIDPETISLKQLEEAQVKYAENIIDHIKDTENTVLDVGCGMGGLSELMINKKLKVEALTPNKNQIEYIKSKDYNITSHHCKFEDFEADNKFGTIINSESLQYISLNNAFDKIEKILLPNGRWIVVDYFRMDAVNGHKSGHLLEDFKSKLKEFGWEISYEQDITKNILPTLSFIYMYVDRFFLPVKHYAFEKLRFKKGWLYYLTDKLRVSIDNKIDKETAPIIPSQFMDEKKYMFFVLEKKKNV